MVAAGTCWEDCGPERLPANLYAASKSAFRTLANTVPELIATIDDYMQQSNQQRHIFVWTASAERLMAKFAKCKEALYALH